MEVRILDLDGGVSRQPVLRSLATRWPLQHLGPSLRMACRWSAFHRFQTELEALAGTSHDDNPALSFLGSGDFHHLSLACLRRLPGPCNLLVLDNHPDWMRGVPLLHCGTWLYHASRLPQVARIFHVGGDVDFDNSYRWLAPWRQLHTGKIVVVPSRRRFTGKAWDRIDHRPLRDETLIPASVAQVEKMVDPYRPDLADLPLYVSFDKDVLTAQEAVVNWDSGHLNTSEVFAVLDAFLNASVGLAGMDVVGDWSPVQVRGVLRHVLHRMEHDTLPRELAHADATNEATSVAVLERLGIADALVARSRRWLPHPHTSRAA